MLVEGVTGVVSLAGGSCCPAGGVCVCVCVSVCGVCRKGLITRGKKYIYNI
jgi:hypothetical protein